MLAKPIDTMAKSFVETDAAALADDARRISSWLEQYRPTLLGQLSLGLAQGTDHATDDYQRTLSKYRSLEHFETSDLRKRQWSWFFWFWFGPLLLLSGLLLIGWWYTQKAGPTVNLLVGEVDTETFTGVVVVLWTVLCVFYYVRALLRYHKAYLQARHQMTLWARTAAALSRQLTHSRHEAYRLRATNRRLARWAEVFSWVVRHPYGRPEPAESLADVHSEVADIGRSETPALSEPEAPPPGPDEVMATAESPPDSQPRADEASRLEAMEGAQGSSGSARTTPGDSEVERALSTQIVDVTLSHAFTEGELRRAVAMSSGYGWLNSLFYRLVRHSFLNLGLNAHEAVRRMDREGSEPQSYLDMFANELWRGDCQREVASELSERLAEHRAEIEETSGSGFVKLAVDALVGNQTVEAFLTEIAAQGTTMRRDLFRPSALVDKAHVLEQGLLWTHSYAESQAGRAPSNVTVFTEEVEPHTERIQLVAVRLDVTGVVDPAGLACFSEKRSEAPRRGDSAGGVDLV